MTFHPGQYYNAVGQGNTSFNGRYYAFKIKGKVVRIMSDNFEPLEDKEVAHLAQLLFTED